MKRKLFLLGAIFILALGVRLASFRGIFLADGIHFNDADSYYHARRIEYGVKNFPRLLINDSYMAYPQGGYCIWPPLFDLIVAALSWIVSWGKFNRAIMETIAVCTAPVLGALTVFPLYKLAKHWFGQSAGLSAAAFLAVLPAHISYTQIGRIDQHVLEALLLTFFLNYYSRCLIWAAEYQDYPGFRPPREVFQPLILAGVSLAAFIFTWQGGIVIPALMTGYFLMQLSLDKARCQPLKSLIAVQVGTLTICLALLFPASWFFLHNEPTISFSYVAFSYFQPVFLLALLSVTIFYGWWLGGGRVGKIGGFIVLLILGGALSQLGFFQHIIQAFTDFIAKRDPWLRSIDEFQPLLWSKNQLDLLTPLQVDSAFFFLFPFFMLILIRRGFSSRGRASNFIWVSGGALFVFLLYQKRFEYYVSIFLALSFGFWLDYLEQLAVKFKVHKTMALAIFILLLPQVYLLRTVSASPVIFPPEALNEALKWLRVNTPPTSFYETPSLRPEYGVYVDWSSGHYLTYLARRPTLVNNFGTHLSSGFNTYLRLNFLQDETEFLDLLAQNRLDYLILQYLSGDLADLAARIEIKKTDYFREVPQADGGIAYAPLPAYYDLIIPRLALNYGVSESAGSLAHLRLIYEGSNSYQILGRQTSVYKIFQVVKGVRVQGQTSPNTLVTARTLIATNRGRQFVYQTRLFADTTGHFELPLPYANQGTPFATRALTPYHLDAGAKQWSVSVKEADVLTGQSIVLPASD